MKVTGWAAIALMAVIWFAALIGYTVIDTVYLNWIGHFGLSFRELVGIAGVLSALTIFSHTSNG